MVVGLANAYRAKSAVAALTAGLAAAVAGAVDAAAVVAIEVEGALGFGRGGIVLLTTSQPVNSVLRPSQSLTAGWNRVT